MRAYVLPLIMLLVAGCKTKIEDTHDSAPQDVDVDGDGHYGDSDCDDTVASVFEGAPELCDGIDNDCDGEADEGLTSFTWYTDADHDTYGDDATAVVACAPPNADSSGRGGDCNDADAAYHPNAEESNCDDPNDYNCDGSVGSVDADGDGFTACEECDDGSGAVNPAAAEVCDGVDDNCDGVVDTDAVDAGAWYTDADGDGYGDDATVVLSCTQPEGTTGVPGDCNDADTAFNPGASEADCNDPADYNCDGSTGYADADGDGYAACQECDDADASVHPSSVEICNAVDDDCDGTVDVGAVDAGTWYADADGDGYGDVTASVVACSAPIGYVATADDCDDTDAAYHPGASETDCSDPADYNCDGSSGYADADGDGVPACSDCDDASASTGPSAPEVCDGVDNNCDGSVDEAGAAGESTWYADVDGDGYGDATVSVDACSAPVGFVSTSDDCNDADAAYNPGASESDCTDPTDYNCDGSSGYSDADGDGYPACEDCDDGASGVNSAGTELCNGVDDNCDGTVDEDASADAPVWYRDLDGDGYGDASSSVRACSAPTGYVASADDCDDTSAAFHPGADESDCTDPTDYNCDGSSGYVDADGDGFPACGDCDDTSASVNTSAVELCNGADDDCDGVIDNADAADAATWYLDLDGDGYGDSTVVTTACSAPVGYVALDGDCNDADTAFNPGASENDCANPTDYNCDGSTGYADADGDGYAACEDCDDGDASANPGGLELCNGADDNCDGTVDEPSAVDAATWYLDADRDGYGDSAFSVQSCSAPDGYVAASGDCDDGDAAFNPAATESDCSDPTDYNCDGSTGYVDADGDGFAACEECDDADASVNPGAVEACNGVDDDCDGSVDVGAADAATWYGDADGDGYGDASVTTTACSAPYGYSGLAGDCNDADGAFNPAADESDCSDPTDYNCDGSSGYTDLDGDGYAACEECDDADPTVNPSGTEVCDGVDNNCDGLVDDDSATDAPVWYRDLDGDGYGDLSATTRACSAPEGYVAAYGDCDDTDDRFNPGATEADCADPADYNCDGSTGYTDADGDGYAACEECDDGDAAVHPGATESCNGVDDDCDGTVDPGGASGGSTYYRDADGDGYGDAADATVACSAPVGYSSVSGDCNDADAAFSPGATESDCSDPTDYNCDGSTGYVDGDGDGYAACQDCDDADASVSPSGVESCNGVDDDCDGTVDVGAGDESAWYADLDGDGYGDVTTATWSCSAPDGYVSVAGDCNDVDAAYNPGATEADCADPADYNCDGSTGYTDADGDGYAACEECDDGDAAVHPGATESCNGVDDDCDGNVDGGGSGGSTWYRDADGDGYGDSADATVACSQPSGYAAVGGDCDDSSASYNPGATEADCSDPTDYNCDGSTGYADADGDGYAACEDCDDTDASVNPSGVESCNGVDDDCDGSIDVGALDESAWYADLDGDGYGDVTTATWSCSAPDGYVSTAGDCDDVDASYNPGAVEADCSDPHDYNCDGSTGYTDADGDGFAACSECDDSNAAVNPSGFEVCDGVDNNCDGLVDEEAAIDAGVWYRDVDGDGYGDAGSSVRGCSAPEGYVSVTGDCDDADAAYNPGATESDCADPNDYNCDGSTGYVDADGDGYPACSECDDADASVHPGAAEACNGVDDDCDGTVDVSATDAPVWYRDIDGDGYGDSADTVEACSAPLGYVSAGGDCNDGDVSYNPGASEPDCADPNDYNCDGSTGYVDADGDGFAACGDCDDADASVSPTGTEVCDGVDNNCDGSVDGGDSADATTWYQDLDGDGYGDSSVSRNACSAPAGFVSVAGDCNDVDAAYNPGASESSCTDPNDYNCDGSTGYADADGDGFAACNDCDDGSASVHPGATELCNGVDDNCDGNTDTPDSADAATWYRDFDGDGYGRSGSTAVNCSAPTGFTALPGDCNDRDTAYNPGADESNCADPNDYNCDGSTGYSDADGDGYAACEECDDNSAAVNPAGEELCDGVDNNCDGTVDEDSATDASVWYQDVDGDGYGDSSVSTVACSAPSGYASAYGDCDDSDAAYNPGATEADCADPHDYNCDGSTGYVDADGDGYAACSECDDGDASVHPGATELCDGVDNDCDGTVDVGAADATTWYGDHDGDGYGDVNFQVDACTAPSGYIADGTDCYDNDAGYHPGAAEPDCTDPIDYNCDGVVAYADADGDGYAACVDCDDSSATVNGAGVEACDGIDNDCNGYVDEATAADATTWYADVDGDGYGDPSVTLAACSQPSGYVALSSDCDDSDAAYNPGAAESDCTDPADYNCDGSTGYADADGDGYPACSECDDGDAGVNAGATEVCDGVDNNCDGTVDEDSALDAPRWYLDADGDGYGDSASSVRACSQPSGYAAVSGDCDDDDAAYNPGATEASCSDPNDYNCDGSTGYVDADGDGYAACTECDDGDASVNPGATELCDGVDNNCDGTVDESTASGAPTWYRDVDGDGYGDTGPTLVACDQPVGYAATGDDCDDADTAFHPGASESDCADPNDYNCDGSTGYANADGDAYAACEDCDDTNSAVNPSNQEFCNGVDDDCDGVIDGSNAVDKSLYYTDADADGYGWGGSFVFACSLPSGYAENPDDCDDTDAAYNPGADESSCSDPNDYNCDGSVSYADADGDGYAACEECDDSDASIHPGATELCDGQDNDCDGTTDEASASDASTWYEDADGDGYGDAGSTYVACSAPSGFVANSSDCDDSRTATHPGATETCNGIDDNCSGSADETGSDASTWYADADGDGYGDAGSTTTACTVPSGFVADASDCDDLDVGANPGETEVCDGVDNNCDGDTDEDAASDALTWYADTDGDTYGNAASTWIACSAPSGYVSDSTDCADTASSRHPGATETCNGFDDDCDGSTDESGATGETTWYTDADGDGYGVTSSGTTSCNAPSGKIATGGDCNDASSAVKPSATETCDSIDNDCDGSIDESGSTGETTWYADVDGDGYGSTTNYLSACNMPSGYKTTGTDCDDTHTAAHPGLTEVCDDTLDNDCDGTNNSCNPSGAKVANATADRLIQGAAAQDFLGSAIAGGDINNDGYSDVVVGGYGVDGPTAGSTSGAAYVFYGPIGSSPTTASAGATITANQTGEQLGTAAAVLLDGTVLLGANRYDGSATDGGAVFVYSGTVSGSLTPSSATATITGDTNYDYIGGALSPAGDVNDDGHEDFLVGGYSYNANGNADAGGVALVYGTVSGSVSFTSSSNTLFKGQSNSEYAGYAVSGDGDVDGDGLPDILVGGYGGHITTTGAGQAYVVLGGGFSTGVVQLTGADGIVTGAATGDALGKSVAIVGDTNLDGYDDFALGADAVDNGATTDVGAAYIFLGDATGGVSGTVSATTADAKFTGVTASDYAGRVVASAGDPNADGKADLLISATGFDNGATSGVGATYLMFAPFSGSSSLSSYNVRIRGSGASDAAGAAAAGVGDVNGDGLDDYMLGGIGGDSSTLSNVGSAWLFYGHGR